MSATLRRVWVLGSGTALPSAGRDNTFFALESEDACWLIDCGGSPYQKMLRVGLSPLRLRGIVLTHAHADHIYGLPALLFQLSLVGYAEVLPLYGLAETLAVARRVIEAFDLGVHCARHEWRLLQDGSDINTEVGEMHVRRVDHPLPTLGVRVSAAGWTVAYSSDTGPCTAAVDLARGADWLLHECTALQPSPGQHSTPEEVGQAARAAGVAHLGIVHYDAAYLMEEAALLARVRLGGYTGPLKVLGDLDAIAAPLAS